VEQLLVAAGDQVADGAVLAVVIPAPVTGS
jgi:multidrug efflux pump subunit AcrA (membrane-fusion protein)